LLAIVSPDSWKSLRVVSAGRKTPAVRRCQEEAKVS